MTASLQYQFLLALLAAILILELLARRFKLPPAAAFILGGMGLAVIPGVPNLQLNPDLVLVVFLPPLLMNGAYFTVWREFRENLRGIMLLAIGAVFFTTLAVGVTAKLLVPGLPWAVCFALGAIVSPPDAVAAEAVLEKLALPGRVNALLQGESLLNDATGLVLFRFAVVAALTGAFSATAAVGSFALLSVGGAAIGFVIGRVGLALIRRLPDSDLAITTTLLLAGVSYIVGERLHVSGVFSTVTTGLILGWHQHTVFSATTRIRSQAFWKVLVFLLESILFILIGLSLRGVLGRIGANPHTLTSLIGPVAGVVVAVIASRFVWVLGGDGLLRVAQALGVRLKAPPSLRVAAVMSWAGMRGVVTLAAALSLPNDLPGRDFLLVAAFAVILATVLIQGSTLGPLIKALQLVTPLELKQREESEDLAWMKMTAAQFASVAMQSRQQDGSERHPRLLEQYGHRAKVAAEYTSDRDAHVPLKLEHFKTVIAAIDAGRAEVLRLHRAGEIHDRVLRDLESEMDLQQLVAESHA